MERRAKQATSRPTAETKAKSVGKQSSPNAKRLKKRRYQHAIFKQPTFLQNPLSEYWEAKGRRPRKVRRKLARRVRTEYQILAMLACFSVSIGLWENFRQLWLQGNGFSAADVSNIVSVGLLLSVIGIIIVGKAVKMPKIKMFMFVVLVLRSINMALLYFLNNSELSILIYASVALDVLSGTLIVTSVYPLLTTVMKSNNVYSRRKLVEYLFRDVGILVGGLIIGREMGEFLVDYNTCLLVAAIFSVLSCVEMWRIKLRITERVPESKFSIMKYIWRSKTQRFYMLYAFFAGAAYMSAIGLRMLILTDYFGVSARMSTNYLLLVGLASDIIGIIALKYFTPKNDYVTLTIKFGIRLLIFVGAFFSDNLFLCFIALTWTLLSSTAYENITDGYYINAVDNRLQLKYNTIKYVATTLGEAVGTFICGQMFEIGVAYIFGASALLIIVQLAAAYYLIYMRHKAPAKRRR